MDAWLSGAQAAIAGEENTGGARLSDREADTLLELARLASHKSGDRRNAPLLCYLVGLEVGRGGELESIAAAIRAL